MKRLLLTSFLLGLIPSAYAADTCNFVSEYYPDVTIEVINGEYNSVGRGTINYKDKPVLNFETGISNGYGGQYFYIYKIKTYNYQFKDDNEVSEINTLPHPNNYKDWFTFYDEIDIRRHLQDIEIILIEAALEKTNGKIANAADILKLRRTTLIEKMKKFSITKNDTNL